mmetsp:Transcript_35194/g.77025  ORF Transcript_35194/g.77025 Transcript_35194/m.77025 type:complete len:357 (+) Transcript_35194:25-1095(+)
MRVSAWLLAGLALAQEAAVPETAQEAAAAEAVPEEPGAAAAEAEATPEAAGEPGASAAEAEAAPEGEAGAAPVAEGKQETQEAKDEARRRIEESMKAAGIDPDFMKKPRQKINLEEELRKAMAEDKEAKAEEAAQAAELGPEGAELVAKFKQLQDLVDSKGESVDPALRAQLAKLEKSIGSLSQTADIGMSQEEAQEQVRACVRMTLATLGHSKPEVQKSFEDMESGRLTKKNAAKNPHILLLAACLTGLSEEHYKGHKEGTQPTLPQVFMDATKMEGADELVSTIPLEAWVEIRKAVKKVRAEPVPSEPLDLKALGTPIAIGAVVLFALFMRLKPEGGSGEAEKPKKKAKGKKKD